MAKDVSVSIDEYLSKSEFYNKGIYHVKGSLMYDIDCGRTFIGTVHKRCAWHEAKCKGNIQHAKEIAYEIFEYLTRRGWKYIIDDELIAGRKEIIF